MKALRIVMFIIGVLIILVGLALLVSVRIEEMRESGETVGPAQLVSLIDAIARLWGQILGSVDQQYATSITVLLIGIVVMAVPIVLPTPTKSQ